ncbi:hypothetical protein PORY_001914 [Pneumocystis oryctolagi]|uniref:Uncharacterized protein n=1 Tax=Pneumocystis oryctolagi TaxID=42067 RepID=A0ACB7CAU2_9ASCO|nr:hypothetical protein PORY_001914 [Pneumocystis oryctolagi]
MSRLSNKTVFITGASSGIGKVHKFQLDLTLSHYYKACAYEFAKTCNSIKLILAARRDTTKIAHDIQSTFPGTKVYPLQFDVSKFAEIEEKISELPEEFRNIDILINNAGFVIGLDRVEDVDSELVINMYNTNILGLILITKKILNIFLKNGNKGDIINIGSISGRESYPNGSIYCSTKAAIRSFTECLRKEQISTRIRVIEIDPGLVETEFSMVRFRGDKSKADSVYKGMEPLTPEDISEIVVFAASRPENVVLAETLVLPNSQASCTHVYRKE